MKGKGALTTTEDLTDYVAPGSTIVIDGRKWKLSPDKKSASFNSKRLTLAADKASIDIDGEYDVFKLKIGCETNAPTQMRDSFKKYVLLGDCEKWDLSLLFFALINSAHSLLPKSTMDEERSSVNVLRDIRNHEYGHIKECGITSKKFSTVKSDMVGFVRCCLPASEEKLRRDIMSIEAAKISDGEQEDLRLRWETEMSDRLDETNSKLDYTNSKLDRLCQKMEEQHNSVKEEHKYDIYFACQPVPNAVQQLCDVAGASSLQSPSRTKQQKCLEHQACKLHLETILNAHWAEAAGQLKYKIRLGDGHNDMLLDHFTTVGARCFVWSALGINLLHKAPVLLGHPMLHESSLPEQWPTVVVVCMKYGSQHVAKAIHKNGAPIVIGIQIDLCSETGFDIAELLLCFLVALMKHDHLTPAIVKEEFHHYRDMDGGLGQRLDSDIMLLFDPDFEESYKPCEDGPWPIKIDQGCDDLPCHNNWIVKKEFADLHLQLQACDLKSLQQAQGACNCHQALKVVAGNHEINRARSLALEVCRHHLYRSHEFSGIYWVATEEQLAELDASMPKDSPVLVWFDTLVHDPSVLDDLYDAIKERLEWDDAKLTEFVATLERERLNTSAKLQILAESSHEKLGTMLGIDAVGDQMDLLDVLQEFATKHGWSLHEAARKWLLNHPTNGHAIYTGHANPLKDMKTLELQADDDDVQLAVLHHDLRLRLTFQDNQHSVMLGPEELAAVEEAVRKEINEQRPVQALYHDDQCHNNKYGWLMVRICVSDIKFLHTLRATVLESCIEDALQVSQLGLKRLEVDLSSFAELYEATSFRLDKLTAHQREKQEACDKKLAEAMIAHMAGAAGAGKTFVGVHLILEKLRANPDVYVLFVAQTHGLVLFVAKWLGQRARCHKERVDILTRVHFMYAPDGQLLDRPYKIDLHAIKDQGRLVLDHVNASPSAAAVPIQCNLVVRGALAGGPGLQATGIEISGASNEYSKDWVNGVYHPTAEIVNGRRAYRREDGEQWLCFSPERYCWNVQSSEYKGTDFAVAKSVGTTATATLPQLAMSWHQFEETVPPIPAAHPAPVATGMVMPPVPVDIKYALVVVDEAHHVTTVTENVDVIQKFVTERETELLYLSDLSQCKTAEQANQANLPPVDVELIEVVRCTQRIVAAAMQFQSSHGKLTRSHCRYAGPPLKAFIFEGEHNMELFAKETVSALEYQDKLVPTLNLHDRLAILVPDQEFRTELLEEIVPMVADSEVLKSRNFKFVSAAEASSIVTFGAARPKSVEQCIVLDTVAAFDGLERLFVIGVGLDRPVQEATGVSTRSLCYRMISRGHMAVIAVDRLVRGGWLEFLTFVKFDDREFDQDLEKIRCNGTAAQKAEAHQIRHATKCRESASEESEEAPPTPTSLKGADPEVTLPTLSPPTLRA